MPYRRNYPATVAEILDSQATFQPDALRAVQSFARSKPWRGTVEERKDKFRVLNVALAAAYGITRPRLSFVRVEADSHSGASYYRPSTHTITLTGRLSVVTFLHEFAHARGADERQACRWSVNLFRRCFPRSFARCLQVGHTLARESTLANLHYQPCGNAVDDYRCHGYEVLRTTVHEVPPRS
jgi:hypothetical protein